MPCRRAAEYLYLLLGACCGRRGYQSCGICMEFVNASDSWGWGSTFVMTSLVAPDPVFFAQLWPSMARRVGPRAIACVYLRTSWNRMSIIHIFDVLLACFR